MADGEEVDSSDEEGAHGSGNDERSGKAKAQPRRKPKFDTGTIVQAVLGEDASAGKGVAQWCPSFFPPEVRENWHKWASQTPNRLSDVPEANRIRTCAMPRKCLPAGVQPQAAPRQQTDLITYRNPSGNGSSRQQLQRTADEQKPLVEGDIEVGQTVALKRAETTPTDEAGWNTPFYLGDVHEVRFAETEDGADSTGVRAIQSIMVHYRMPRFKNGWSDDMARPWGLVCNGGASHVWTKQCERRTQMCVAAGKRVGASGARMLHQADVLEIFETGIKFTGTGQLDKTSKERLAESAPVDQSWHEALGLHPKAASARKQRKRKK